ncbi:kinesin-like protein KIN-12F [Lolium rigidum]|uniref:kinesin-like protein KIN-12F n=1 Tax=Lolium rigidum TaxID=89674 RepID=UPI001F5C6E29|nr:kinesin-like protein KIN-12F [Lolium rigidum]
MENNVQVVIRVRPLNNTEKNLCGYNRCLRQESAQSITWTGHPELCFKFDHVACESVNQEVLFRVAGLPMVENCMAGYNSCVFSYGQTGSGKTHTMLGEITELGVNPGPECGMIPRIFELLIARIREEEESRRDEKLKYNCKCSFLEIYNEQITDLVDPSSTNLLLREDTNVGAYVENLTEREVTSVGDIMTLLTQSSVNRKVSATNMNSASSRSHTVFTCTIESRWEKDSICNSRFARLNLVDLAGSERQTASGAEGERLKEASNINKSLLTLSLVITNLVDRTSGKKWHIPYRDSKLTFLLQDSLGGNSKTLIIANVSPSLCSSKETLSTLKFAQRARRIQNNALVNEDSLGDVQTLQNQIYILKERGSADNELQMLQSQIAKLLQEKENARECHLKSQETIEDLSSQVLQLQSEMIDKEKCYEARLEMCSVLKGKLLVDINNNFGLIAKKEQEATELSSKLDSFGNKILRLQAQEEEMLARADSMYNKLSVLTEEIDITNMNHNEKISVLEKQLANAASELGAVSLENNELRSQLNCIERRSYFMEEELTRESNATEKMEEKLTELKILLDERNSFLQKLQNDFSKLSDEKQCCDSQALILRDKLGRAQALAEEREAIATEAWQIADEMKTCAEEKVKEVKVLERSVDDLQSTVCALEEQLARKVSQPNAVSVAKNKQGTELGKNIMHLHRQEEAMLSGSNSMHSEQSILIDEIFATNRGALAAESKENEDLHHQLDEALLLNEMLKDRMLEDLSLLQVNNAIPVNDMEGCSQFQLCNLLANYHHESVVINTIANDIETIVLASELKQHKAEVQEQMLMCTEVVEGLKTESTLWKVDQELGSAIIDDLLEESSNIRTDRESLKRNKDKIRATVKRAKAATSLMCSLPK